ncbi:Na/Pi cotransporter family protein [Fastidiosipila sanguinis]|uniref:Na/Pi cotransporter n=1 Tax=Fastidiosipila sanguinis TaxID=236753 RepID=A0A2S0KMM4_9FIRM|nr:Na/Pi cotransporter family protein [Fastidiosipila sanguinis]AVM42273.1 Na/Pi cotransporter [Fastidiosipila sanguinis]
MDIYSVLDLLGGLALFLFGLNVMGNGLQNASSGQLENILGKLTSNKFKGVFLGIVVTTVVQSSSAVTIMLVALVNSGVMKLKQTVPVIMGANIGTTITAWILSLSGLDGDSFIVQILKPSTFTPILAIIAVIMLSTAKTERKKAIANTILGFSVIMFGMSAMSASMSGLQGNPNFTRAFTIFTNPVLGIIVGAVVTAIVQSSSASIGILQALSTTGEITFASTFPIIMGQNIGTCITAMLAAIGSKKNAKRVSVIHLTFNILGTIIFVSLFYVIDFLWPFSFMGDKVTEFSIAMVHTIFNLFTTLILLPFTKQLVEFSRIIIPSDADTNSTGQDSTIKTLNLLDPLFLEQPHLALNRSYEVLVKMMEYSDKALKLSFELFDDYTDEKFLDIEELEQSVDRFEDALKNYTSQLLVKELNEDDSQRLTLVFNGMNDVERICDHAMNFANTVKASADKSREFSKDAREDLHLYFSAVQDIVDRTYKSLGDQNSTFVETIPPLEEHINNLDKHMVKKHIKRMKKGKCKVKNGIAITDVFNGLERVSDHCNNISLYILQLDTDNNRTHDFENNIDKNSEMYKTTLAEFEKVYPLV